MNQHFDDCRAWNNCACGAAALRCATLVGGSAEAICD
jgi:hypothetical protein